MKNEKVSFIPLFTTSASSEKKRTYDVRGLIAPRLKNVLIKPFVLHTKLNKVRKEDVRSEKWSNPIPSNPGPNKFFLKFSPSPHFFPS